MAALPLLTVVEESADALDPAVRAAMKIRLSRGVSFGEAMGDFFPPWQRAIVRMGETTGRLDLSFSMISDILEARRAYWLGLAAKLAPAMLLVQLSPLIMSAPLWASRGAAAYFTAVLATLAKLYVPLLGLCLAWPWLKQSRWAGLQRRSELKYRFCVCLSTLMRAGIPLTQAIEISCLAADRPAPPPGWENGETVVERVTRLGLFSQEELGLLNVAEVSGSVEQTLTALAEDVRSAGFRVPRR